MLCRLRPVSAGKGLPAFLNKAAAYAGYDYNARGLTHDVLFEMGEVFRSTDGHAHPSDPHGGGGAGHRHLRKRGQGRPHAAGL